MAAVGHDGFGYVLEDLSQGGLLPNQWAQRAIDAFDKWEADRIVAEVNFGGDMVYSTIQAALSDAKYKEKRAKRPGAVSDVPVRMVHASRGKDARAEPVAALYEQGRVYHAKEFVELENQLCLWVPEDTWSPDRLDALVWAISDLMLRVRDDDEFVAPEGIPRRVE